MDIQAIGNRAFSVYIGESELVSRHLKPGSVTVSAARELVRDCIGGCGGAMSLELYPGRHELLIFVRRCSDEPEFYSFADLEELLPALRQLPAGAVSSVYFYNGAYILAVWPPEGSGIPALAEFGRPLSRSAAFLCHLREHGETVCEGDAAETLTRVFDPVKNS